MAMRPPMPSMILSRRTKILLAVVAILILLIVVLLKLSGVYVNFLWFDEVGHHNVYSTILWTRVSLFFIFGVLMAVLIGANLVVSYLLRPPFRPMSPEQQNLQNYALLLEPRRRLILAAVMILALLFEGMSAQGDWQAWQLWLHGGSFGIKDPQFHKDISFYAFDYPVYRLLLSFGFTAVIFSLILSVGIHYLTGGIRLQTAGPKMTLAARRHLTVLVFAFMVLKAGAYWMDRYGFVFSDRSKFTGASYTDVHSALPAKTILFWITIVLALGVLASLWLRSALLPGIGFVVLLVLSILMGGIYPAAIQKFSVGPNASDKERPYISRNIKATRQAYDIVTRDAANPNGSVIYEQYQANPKPAPDAITNTDATVDNIRILDPNVISPTFLNAQKIGVPYGFSPKLDVDRYTLPEKTATGTADVKHDYIVAVREQVPGSNLSGAQDNWINQHTVYTHGYGFVAAQADVDVTNGDASDYTEGDIPPKGPLNLTTPQVYYGQLMNDYAIVGAKGSKREYDANGSTVTYHGKGGVALDNLFTRLAFAVQYKETNFLLNDAVSASGAKIIFNRDPKLMVEKVAPFLTVDGDPYPFVDQDTGHVVWMVDGYTTMANYPYSERKSLSELTGTSLRQGQKDTQINYIRNSVKATVDAYDGSVHLYQWDTKDPLLKSWMNVFPRLVEPASKMPATVRAHVRYPQDLFNVQRGLLAQYHISDPVAAYNGRGKWAVPADPFSAGGQAQPAYYMLARPPGSTANAPTFQLTTPMVVNNSSNLAAYVSADSDSNYGTLTVLEVPTQQTVLGPAQVAADLKSTAKISKDITQLDQGQSTVVHGNLLTLPVGDSFLYVEPLYVASTGSTSSYPTLQRVLVRYGNKIGYGETLFTALQDISEERTPGASIDVPGQTTGNSGSPPSNTPTSTPTGSGAPSSSSKTPTAGPTGLPSIIAQIQDLQSQQASLSEQQQRLLEQLTKLLSPSSNSASSAKPSPSK